MQISLFQIKKHTKNLIAKEKRKVADKDLNSGTARGSALGAVSTSSSASAASSQLVSS